MYSDVVLKIFNNPENPGRISKPDGIADMYNENQTAHIEFSIRVENDIITDCKFRAQANPYIIAICSTITTMVKGKMVSMVFLDPYGIKEQLGDHADTNIMFCINCFKLVIDNYKEKLQKGNVKGLEEQELTEEPALEETKARLEDIFNLLNVQPSEEMGQEMSNKNELDDFNLFDDDDFGEDF